MDRSIRLRLIIAVALVTLGILFVALPKDWIEEVLHFEPDGGNGAIELLLAVVPTTAGLGLAIRTLLAHHIASRTRQPASATPTACEPRAR